MPSQKASLYFANIFQEGFSMSICIPLTNQKSVALWRSPKKYEAKVKEGLVPKGSLPKCLMHTRLSHKGKREEDIQVSFSPMLFSKKVVVGYDGVEIESNEKQVVGFESKDSQGDPDCRRPPLPNHLLSLSRSNPLPFLSLSFQTSSPNLIWRWCSIGPFVDPFILIYKSTK